MLSQQIPNYLQSMTYLIFQMFFIAYDIYYPVSIALKRLEIFIKGIDNINASTIPRKSNILQNANTTREPKPKYNERYICFDAGKSL